MHLALSPRHTPHSRVREMLRTSRSTDGASPNSDRDWIQNTPTYSQAFVSTVHSSNTQQGGGVKSTQNKRVFVGVATVSLLLGVFVVAGSYMDAYIHHYNEQQNAENDYQTHLVLLGLQIAFNVFLLVVPYLALCKYDTNGYTCQYYYVVGALWVLALHAQPHLKDRFCVLLSPDVPDIPDTTATDNDHEIIANYVRDAQEKVHARAPETENLQYKANLTPLMAPQLRPLRDEPVQFSSTDLLPQATEHPHQHNNDRGTNIADLI